MAESKGGGIFAKVISKQFIRTKAKVLQNFGKYDRTTDEAFESYVNNISKQQATASRLQKELKHYMACVKALSGASHNLCEAITDTYEPEWVEQSTVKSSADSIDLLWGDFLQKINEQVHTPLVTYLNNFHDVKQKVKKRERKMVDYDNARHNYDSLQHAKKKDDVKIAKSQEELDEAKRIFDCLNSDLHQELPDLYDRRLDFYVTSLQALFSAEEVFHQECANINNILCSSIDNLSKENGKGSYKISRPQVSCQPQSSSQKSTPSNNQRADANSVNSSVSTSSDKYGEESAEYSGIPEQDYEQVDVTTKETHDMPSDPHYQPSNEGPDDDDEYTYVAPPIVEEPAMDSGDSIYTVPTEDPAVYQVPESNLPLNDDLPSGVLYQVKATHDYNGADEDELTFSSGDVISVLPYDDPEDEDEGWLLGMLTSSGVKGVFPANFTKPI